MIFAIKNITAYRVNLLMNDYAAGLPSPLSFLGLGDSIVRQLGLTPWSARALPVLHSVTPSQGRTKPEMEPKSSVFSPIEIIEDLTGTVKLSLLLDLPGCNSDADVREAMASRRIAGGIIADPQPRVEQVASDGSALRGIRRGYAMVRPEQPERRITSTGDEHSLAGIARLLFPAERAPGHGWIVPVAVGHHLLEDPGTAPQRIRTRSREVPHVFTEPVLGIAELISVRNRRLTALTSTEFSDLFWAWNAREDLVLGHSAYHANNSNRTLAQNPLRGDE